MSNVTRATLVINETYADEYVKMHMTPRKVAAALDDAGCLAPDPQIIRTPSDLEALDPFAVLIGGAGDVIVARELVDYGMTNVARWLPAVVVASGERLRACREALEGETT